MKPILISLLMVLATGLAQAGTVEVRFIQPERYSDGGRQLGEAERFRAELAAHLTKLGAERLPADQSLLLEVLDIDLAGEPRMASRADDPRVLRGRADWPRIELRYSLRSGDQVLASGQEVVSDIAYMDSSLAPTSTQSLPYENRMLTRWFAQRFGAAAH